MKKRDIYEFLSRRNINYEITEHEAVFSMDEARDIPLPYENVDAKNLFIRDKKKNNYYLITVKGDKRVDLNEFRKNHNTTKLSFASPEDLLQKMGIRPGSVSPFGLLNDNNREIKLFIDEEFFTGERIIGLHPNENTATVWMDIDDLLEIIKEHGNSISLIKI